MNTQDKKSAIDTVDNFTINLHKKVSHKKLWIGFICTLIAIILYLYFKFPVFDIKDFMAILTGGVVVTTLLYHAENLHLNKEVNIAKIVTDRKVIALNLIGEWHKPDMMKLTIMSKDFFDKHLATPNKQSNIIDILHKEGNEEQRLSVITILNFFEKVSLAVEKEAADEAILKDFFKSLFKIYFFRTKELIDLRRKEYQDTTVFIKFETINKKWQA